jgi:di/tricarboxylate transporter
MGLYRNNVFRVLHVLPPDQKDIKKVILSILIFAGVIAAAGLNLLDLPIAALIGMVLVFGLQLITPEQAYRQVDWRVLILIGCMLTLGTAIQYTGTANYLSSVIVEITAGLSPHWLLGGFFLLTMLLSQPMSNQAASAVVVPVAVQTALELGLNPRTFAIMIVVGASTSFLTPLEPACLMVYGPGNYRFADFLKVGSILSLLIFIIAIILVPLLWPLTG